MNRRTLPLALIGLGLCAQDAQRPLPTEEKREETTLPDGRLKSEAILKSDHEANLKDLDEIDRLVEAIRKDLKKNDRHGLSMSNLKNLEEIEKVARRVNGRMRRL